jgi:hypothetical protein
MYLMKSYCLEEKAWARDCKISIIVDGSKLDDYCHHITCGLKMTEPDAHDPLLIYESDPQKRVKLVFEVMQSEKNSFHIVYLIAKDNTSTYKNVYVISLR